jgi:phosphoglycolate phosphatase
MIDMVYKAIIFDLDGTLLYTLTDIANSANKVLARLGFPQHELDAYKYFVGDGRESLVMRILPNNHRDAATVAKVVSCLDSEYDLHWADTTHPYDGIPELLQALTEHDIKMAVLSNKPDDSTKLTVSTLLADWRFEIVLGVRPSVPKKPDPAAALEIAKYFDITPGEFLYIGDTDTDMNTAVAAGMYPIGVLWGYRTADELLAAGAEALISKPIDLLKML